MDPRFLKEISVAFKLSGYFIRSEDTNYIAMKFVEMELNYVEQNHTLTKLIEYMQTQNLLTAHVSREHLEKAFESIRNAGLDKEETVFDVINAYDVPRFCYNNRIRKFQRGMQERKIFCPVMTKSTYLRSRYEILLQKTLRHELFSIVADMGDNQMGNRVKKYKLSYAENLLATSATEEVVILGLLTQLEEGRFYVEDLTGSVRLDLSSARYSTGFFCEGTFVLVEGVYNNKILKVNGMGFPPAEDPQSSRLYFGGQNTWGGKSETLLKISERLQDTEQKKHDATIVFLSDVRLDMPEVMNRLRKLFEGYDACPPVAIVLMGPFAAVDRNYYALRKYFTALIGILENCNSLKEHTDLILVPSGDDPAAPNMLPRGPLPTALLKELLIKYPRLQLVTNPCRLQYCSQQILVCRIDLMAKFCRNTLHFPSDTSNIEQHYARTLICQNHLVPIHPIAMPIQWEFDCSLWLYPLPDLIVIGDSCQSFTTTQHSCTIVNTGSFVKSKFGFKVYIPSTRTIENSEIPDDDADDDVGAGEEDVPMEQEQQQPEQEEHEQQPQQ